MKKLIAVKFKVKEEDKFGNWKTGDEYTYFTDPETGKFYMPNEGFSVSGENLQDRFSEVLSYD